MSSYNKKSRTKATSNTANTHFEMIKRVMLAGRENATNSMLFHQGIAHILGLHVPDMRCLELIARRGPTNPSELAKLTGLTTGAVTVLIDRLEKAGLVQRKPDENDRRKTVLATTTRAKKLMLPLYEPMARGMAKLLSQYSKDELTAIEKFFIETKEFWREESEKLSSIDVKSKL